MGTNTQGRPVSRWTPVITVILTGVALLGSTAPVAAQMELAVIVGHIKDEAGQPLEDVKVILRDQERGREVSLKTDKEGRFYRRGLQAGVYNIVVEKAGYQPIDDKLTLTAGTDRRFDFKLARATPEGAVEFTNAVAAYNKGNFEEAAKGFEAAIAKADLPEIRVNLALAYMRMNRTADAVAQLEKAASMAPNDPKVQFQLGGAYIDMKQFDKAIAAFEGGLAMPGLAPADPVVYEAQISLASLYFAEGRIDDARGTYEKALAANPTGAAAKLGLGKVAFNKGDVDKALELFKEVVAMAPGSPQAAEAEGFITALTKK